MRQRWAAALLIAGLLILPARARGQTMDPSRAARIRIACADATTFDFGHLVIGAGMVAVGVGLYIPNLLQDPANRPVSASVQRGMGLGLGLGGAVLMLRPSGPGGVRVVDTCERLLHNDPDSPLLLRNAERYLNALAVSDRKWALLVTIAGIVVGAGGAVVAYFAANDIRDQVYWASAFLTVPLALWIDMMVPAPPLRAALRFHRGAYYVPRFVSDLSVGPLVNAVGLGVSGRF